MFAVCERSGENVREEPRRPRPRSHQEVDREDGNPLAHMELPRHRHLHERHRLTHGKDPSLWSIQTWTGESEPRRTKDEVQATQMDMLETQSMVSHGCMREPPCGFPAAARTAAGRGVSLVVVPRVEQSNVS